MSIPTEHVLPGALIRADLMNDVIETLASFDSRITALEISSPPVDGGPYPQVVITSVSPATVHVGDQITVTGSNFDYNIGAAVVHLDTTIVPSFTGASNSNSSLTFVVPSLGVLPSTGKAVILTVFNAVNEASRTITVLPRSRCSKATWTSPMSAAARSLPAGRRCSSSRRRRRAPPQSP